MLGQSKRSILKDFFFRKNFTKVEIKKILFKSIIQNQNLDKKTRSMCIYQYSKIKRFESISKQNNNICLKTGRYKGVLKHTCMSRHFVKKLGTIGSLQNFKISSW